MNPKLFVTYVNNAMLNSMDTGRNEAYKLGFWLRSDLSLLVPVKMMIFTTPF